MSVFKSLIEEKKVVITDEVKELLGITEVFEIDSEKKLDWYLQKQMQCNAEIDGIKQQFKTALQMVETRQRHLEELYGEQVKNYVLAEYDKTGKKTVVRPYGTLRLRDTQPTWVKGLEVEFQHWMAAQDNKGRFGIVPKTYACDLDKVKHYAETARTVDGVMDAVEGLQFVEGGIKMSISYPGDKA